MGFEENLEIGYQDNTKLSVTLHIMSKKRKKKKKKASKKERNWGNTHNFRDDLHLCTALLNRRLLELPLPTVFFLIKRNRDGLFHSVAPIQGHAL